jgi:hypothetical protein
MTRFEWMKYGGVAFLPVAGNYTWRHESAFAENA